MPSVCHLLKEINLTESRYRYEVDSVDEEEWNRIVGLFDDASLQQTWAYGTIRWEKMAVSHIVLRENGDILAAAQVRIIRLMGCGVAYLAKGPLCRLSGLTPNREVYAQIFRAIHDEYCRSRRCVVYVNIRDYVQEKYPIIEAAIKVGFRIARGRSRHRSILIDLSPSVDELRKYLRKRWREKLNRAERASLKIVEGTDDSLYGVFLKLYTEMYARKRFIEFVDVNRLRMVQAALPDPYKMKIMVCESQDGPASGLLWSLIGDRGVSICSATGDLGLKNNASYLLRWTMLTRCKALGARFLDQGGIDSVVNEGSYRFKAGMGGSEVEQYWPLEVAPSRSLGFIVGNAFRLRAYCRERLRAILK